MMLKLVAIALAITALASCGGVSREPYIERNEEVLRTVAQFPHATRIGPRSTPYFDADNARAPVAGYVTTWKFLVARHIEFADVRRFYLRHLRAKWDVISPAVNFRHGDTALTLTFAGANRFEVVADHKSFESNRR